MKKLPFSLLTIILILASLSACQKKPAKLPLSLLASNIVSVDIILGDKTEPTIANRFYKVGVVSDIIETNSLSDATIIIKNSDLFNYSKVIDLVVKTNVDKDLYLTFIDARDKFLTNTKKNLEQKFIYSDKYVVEQGQLANAKTDFVVKMDTPYRNDLKNVFLGVLKIENLEDNTILLYDVVLYR